MSYSGIFGAEVYISEPGHLPLEETLTLSASVRYGEVRDNYEIYWIIDGNILKKEEVSLTQGENVFTETVFTYEYKYDYSYGMPSTGTAQFIIKDTLTGKELSDQCTYTIENYPDEHFYDGNILEAVTTGYKGDRTLQWAENNDYTELEKNLFVNTMAYESDTQYLIWVSISHQRVNVFEKLDGRWKLIRSSIVATGAPRSPTPVGVYKTTYKQRGWFTEEYNCFPVVRFLKGSGYAFHSRLYYPGSMTRLSDARIGYPISHGCIRMYNEDVQWLYDYIPESTTVVVF